MPSPPRSDARALLPQSERSWQRQVVELAQLLGWVTWHDQATNSPRRCRACGAVRTLPRNVAGLPDLLLVRPPRVLFVELKAERKRPDRAQADWLAVLARCPGVEAYCWRPSDWPRVLATLGPDP